MILSQSAHGTHVAGRLHRKGLGTRKGGGEFIKSADWRYPLELCFFAVSSVGKKLAYTMGGNARPFLTDAFCHKFQVALKRLQNEKMKWPTLSSGRIKNSLDTLQAKLGALKRLQTETVELDTSPPVILDDAFQGEL